MEEETLDGGPKGEGKEKLGEGEGEWVSLNTLSLKKTKIWQDYTTSLEPKRREERGVFFFMCFEMKEMVVYIVVVEKIWMECHLMKVDKESWT